MAVSENIDHRRPVDIPLVAREVSARVDGAVPLDRVQGVVAEIASGARITTFVSVLAEGAIRRELVARRPQESIS